MYLSKANSEKVIKMQTSNIIGAVVISAVVVAGKVALKAGILAAIFGGSVAANNAYQSRVAEVKSECAEYNRTHSHSDSYFVVDETQRQFIEVDSIKSIPTAKDVDYSVLNNKSAEIKADIIDNIVKMGDDYTNKFLIKHGWQQVVKFTAANGDVITSVTVSEQDL